ncbi:retroviral-like aspartic protease family protein [Neiella marina]|uniref:Retroviral-like aspartic protease family protein n=1 Tax=Neiella holothuriorum TaxID=2870530 RepID=A0ABS7EJ90_9GAMM|nr:aspartyl protease family protein [Neiella holothuriorum]MBW8192423.1 retroviral-like aspartic protease family protein [Neiella holothuriorum]
MMLKPKDLLLTLWSIAASLIYVGAVNADDVKSEDILINQTDTGRLWLDTSINDFSGKMLVDTGSSGSVLDQKYLPRIGKYKALSIDKGWGIGDQSTHIDNLSIEVSSFSVAGESLNNRFISVHRNVLPADELIGIIGIDTIKELRAGMQFSPDNIVLSDRRKAQSSNSQNTAIDVNSSSLGMMYLEVTMQGKKVGLIIDSGADYSIINSEALDNLKLESSVLPGAYTSDINGKKLSVRRVKPTNIEMNGTTIRFEKLFAVPLSSAIKNQSFSTEVIGVIGLFDLKRLEAYLDFNNHKLHVRSTL